MLKTRVIPCLLLKNKGLVKTVKFKDPKYVGDPINAVKIFNDKEVDELFIVDIEASKKGHGPDFDLLERICKESFMPVGYGGGIKTIEEVKKLFWIGYEKVCINNYALKDPEFIIKASDIAGSQSVVISIDIKRDFFGNMYLYDHTKGKTLNLHPVEYACKMEALGAGEIFLNSVNSDGKMSGFEIKLIKMVSSSVKIPVVSIGGAGKIEDFEDAVKKGGADAVSAGSFFVFYGPHRAVLISYPKKNKLKEMFN